MFRNKTSTHLKSSTRNLPVRVIIFTVLPIIVLAFVIVTAVIGYREYVNVVSDKNSLTEQYNQISTELTTTLTQLQQTKTELDAVKSEDQFVKNQTLQKEITDIQTTFSKTVTVYEEILDLRGDGAKTQPVEAQLSKIFSLLSKRDYKTTTTELQKAQTDIQTLRAQLAALEPPVASNIPVSNAPPASGYTRQAVETSIGTFQVDILSADLGSTRVVVETASAGDCRDNCPTASLADFISRAGGFAGINGPYFCPAEYPSCAGKTNSFDTLIMNKNKTYFNSDNNVYSTVPAFIFSTSARLVGRSSDWGRDTGPDSVIASQPMLLSGGNITFGGDGDPKKGSRGARSFIASKGNTVYIGVVRGATVAEVSHVLKTLGLENALNLDSGGSTAFMANGRYVAGPGRNTPFGIVLVRR